MNLSPPGIYRLLKYRLLTWIWLGMLSACATQLNQGAAPGHDHPQGSNAARTTAARVSVDGDTKSAKDGGSLAKTIQAQNILLARKWLEIDQAISEGKIRLAEEIIAEVAEIDPSNPRLKGARLSLLAATDAAKASRASPGKSLPASPTPDAEIALGRRLPSLDFRDAPLRAVLDALARMGNLSFVFDKDVRTEVRVTVALRETTVKDALRAVLLSQQLDYKALNSSSIVIFQATAQKQRDYQELQSRSFFLDNIDAKQAQTLVRGLVKTRDLFIDEKLNLLVMKDTPAAIRYAEQLIESVDQAEPEVLLDVMVVEISSSKARDIGLRLPSQAQLGLAATGGSSSDVTRSNWAQQVVSTSSPSISATLKANLANGNLLSNPSIRVKSREKARIHIGEKLPVFTSIFNGASGTSGASNTFSTQLTFLEVGLKLDVEPTIHLSKEVAIKLGLEVSNVIERVLGPAQSVGYRIGTRNAATTLRLRDGETQVLAGLIRDDDRRTAVGVPGLLDMPILGRLFGQHIEEKDRTEIILLITPRIVRSIEPPAIARRLLVAGTESAIGVTPFRMSDRASAAVVGSLGRTPAAPAEARPAPQSAGAPAERTPVDEEQLSLNVSGPQAVKLNAEFEVVLQGTSKPAGLDSVIEVNLEGEQATFSDGSRGAQLVPMANGKATIRVRAGAAAGQVQLSVTGARSSRGEVVIEPVSPLVVRIEP